MSKEKEKPEYEVMLDFPQLVFKFEKGDLLVRRGIHYYNGVASISEREIVKYPEIFKKIEHDSSTTNTS